MKLIDILLIASLAVVVAFAVRRTLRLRKSGGCGCGCSGCPSSGSCGASSGTGDRPKEV